MPRVVSVLPLNSFKRESSNKFYSNVNDDGDDDTGDNQNEHETGKLMKGDINHNDNENLKK